MDIFLKFVIDFGTENAVRVFANGCFAKRALLAKHPFANTRTAFSVPKSMTNFKKISM